MWAVLSTGLEKIPLSKRASSFKQQTDDWKSFESRFLHLMKVWFVSLWFSYLDIPVDFHLWIELYMCTTSKTKSGCVSSVLPGVSQPLNLWVWYLFAGFLLFALSWVSLPCWVWLPWVGLSKMCFRALPSIHFDLSKCVTPWVWSLRAAFCLTHCLAHVWESWVVGLGLVSLCWLSF